MARWLPAAQIAFCLALALFEGPAEALCALAVVATVASGALRGYRPKAVELGILVWAAAGFVGHVGFDGRVSSADTTRPLLALALFVGVGLVRATPKTLERCAWVFLGGLTVNAAYGLLQLTVGELPLDPYLLPNPKSGQIWIPGRVFHERASSGLFYNRLRLAHLGVAGLALLVMIVAERSSAKRTRLWGAAALAILGAGVLFTYARMAALALVVALVVIVVVSRVRWIVTASIAGVGALGTAAFLATDYGQRRIASLSTDLAVRRAMVEAAVELVRTHPWFGVGHGIYRSAVLPHMPPDLGGVTSTSPHNQWLQVLAETGIVGLMGFSVAFVGALVLAYVVVRGRRGREDHEARLVRLGFLVLVMVFIIGITHFALHHASVGLMTWTAVGVAIGAARGLSPRAAAS